MANEGARPQRLLWASTPTKNPDASHTLYSQALAAPFTINTIPEAALHAFADHGRIGGFMPADGSNGRQTLASFAEMGIDHRELGEQLQWDGTDAFDKSWKSLLASIAAKHEQPTTCDE